MRSMLKKISVIGLSSLVAFSLTACGNANKKANNGVQSGTQQLSPNKALGEVKNEYQGIANVTYDAKHKSLIFWVNSTAHANKVQSSATKEAHWFTKTTHRPDTQAQIRLTGKAARSVQKLSQNKGSNEPPQIIAQEQKKHRKHTKKTQKKAISRIRHHFQPAVSANSKIVNPNRTVKVTRKYPIINRR